MGVVCVRWWCVIDVVLGRLVVWDLRMWEKLTIGEVDGEGLVGFCGVWCKVVRMEMLRQVM